MTRPGSLHIVLLLLALLLALGHGFLHWDDTIDDAYISFRYAANLAAGEGLVFNPGERVEGYSNLLWTLLMALAILLRLDPMLAAKLAGLASLVVTLLVVDRLLARTAAAWAARLAGPLLLAFSVPLAFWSVQGMETPLFTVLLCLAFCRYLEELDRDRGFPWSALLFALACLTRPEGPLYIVVFLVVRLIHPGRPRLRDGAWLLTAALPLAGHLLWRLSYYGEWLPNTWFAKSTADAGLSPAAHAAGTAYLGAFLARGWALPALFALLGLAAALIALRPGADRVRAARLLLPVPWLAASLFFAWQSNGDWMPEHRFLVPAVPALALLAAGGVDGLARLVRAAFRRSGRAGDLPLRLAALALAALLVTIAAVDAAASRRGPTAGRGGQHPRLLPMAMYLMETLRDGETVVYGDVGIVGYLNPGLRIIDNRGLVHRTMARLIHSRPNRLEDVQRHHRELQQEFSERRPEAVVVVINRKANAPVWQTEVYAGHPALRRNYVEARRMTYRKKNMEIIYLRCDVAARRPAPGEVIGRFQRAVALAPRVGALQLRLAERCREAGREALRRQTLDEARRRFDGEEAFIRKLEKEARR